MESRCPEFFGCLPVRRSFDGGGGIGTKQLFISKRQGKPVDNDRDKIINKNSLSLRTNSRTFANTIRID